MTILIDGYNLLHLSGLLPARLGPGGLERARLALANLLAASLQPDELRRTTVVFDAAHAPSGLPREFTHRGVHVRFADEGKDADTVLEDLIRREPTPHKLVVVSSDHRIQKAARHRKAQAVDSDVWYDELLAARWRRTQPSEPEPEQAPPQDLDYWLSYFGGAAALAAWEHDEAAAVSSRASVDLQRTPTPIEDEKTALQGEIDNPFPEGYADDLLEDE